MSEVGSLAGVRVLDLTRDLGRFATTLLAGMGADVVKIAGWGQPGTAMAHPAAAARGGLADWVYDGAKRRLDVDPAQADQLEDLRRLAARADIVLDDLAPGELAALGELAELNPALVHVSLTPFGRGGPRQNWRSSDLVAGALGGVCAVTGLPDAPLNSWGRQNYHFGGFVAAIAALAGLHDARQSGRGRHVDVSLHEVVTGSIENVFMQYFYVDHLGGLPALPTRQGALHWLGVYDVVPARHGTLMITPTPSPAPLIAWMLEDGFEEAERYVGLGLEEILARRTELMATLRRFVLRHDAGFLFTEGQRRRIAFGEVQSVPQLVANPQFAHRRFFRPIEWEGPELRLPARPAQLHGTPHPGPRPPAAASTPVQDVLAAWPPRPGLADRAEATPGPEQDPQDPRPLGGVRIADFTWVLAGPFCTRLLGDLGADVIKLQTEERATLVNKPDYPYYAVWNRSKRSALLDMKHPDALDVARRLVQRCDVLVENYSAGVLARWGLDWETLQEWNPRLIYVTMSGCGHDGPWSNVLSYAPTVHALCGLTYLTNPADRRDVGCGFSLNDHAAGFMAAVEILGALEARRVTGKGQRIDLAQLEVGAWLVSTALIDHLANGRTTEPNGNADGLLDHVPNEIYPSGDGRWLAVSATDDDEWQSLCRVMDRADLGADPSLAGETSRRAQRARVDAALAAWCAGRGAATAMEQLQAAGVPAGMVQNAEDLYQDPQHRARGFWRSFKEHPHFGERPYDRFPALWSDTGLEPYRRAPYFGEHNFEVYGELVGLSDEEIAVGMGEGLFQ